MGAKQEKNNRKGNNDHIYSHHQNDDEKKMTAKKMFDEINDRKKKMTRTKPAKIFSITWIVHFFSGEKTFLLPGRIQEPYTNKSYPVGPTTHQDITVQK